MKCNEALNILDATNDLFDGQSDERWDQAMDHLETCDNCAEMTAARQVFDEQMAQAITNVAIPADLKQILLDNAEASHSPSHQPEPIPQKSRGRIWAALVAVAVFAIVALCTWAFLPEHRPGIAAADIPQTAVASVDAELPQYNGQFQPVLPHLGWTQVIDETEPKGLLADDEGRHLAAAFVIQFADRQGNNVRGLLVVTPARELDTLPKESIPDSSQVQYFSSEANDYAIVSWQEGEFAYFCVVEGGSFTLERLHQQVESWSA